MKKILMLLATILLSISIIGCSSAGKKYDDNINKILKDRNFERNQVNIIVYDDVQLNTERVQGKFTFYKINYKNDSGDNRHKWYVINTNGGIDNLGDSEMNRIGLPEPTYKEINNKNLDK